MRMMALPEGYSNEAVRNYHPQSLDNSASHAAINSYGAQYTSVMTATQASKLVVTEDHTLDNWVGNTSASHIEMRDSFEDNITLNISLDFDGYPYPSHYPWWHIIMASVVVTAIMLVIVIGNALVVIAIATDRQLKGLQNWFIASLAVSDLFVGLLIMPLSLANELMGYWYFGTVLCELWLATDVLLCTASILNLCLISLDRYWSITRAISYVKQRTKKRAAIMITLVWILSMILCFPPLAGWKRPQPSVQNLPLCVLSEEPGYVVYSVVGSFYIPLIVMILVYFKIFLAARARARRNLKKPNSLPPPTNGKSSSTTTSFSNQGKQHDDHNKVSPAADIQSDDDDDDDDDMSQMDAMMPDATPIPETEVTSGLESTTDPEMGYKMSSVTNHRARIISHEEQRKLLSEDTDSEAQQKSLPGYPKSKHIHFSEETDSYSDSGSARPILNKNQVYTGSNKRLESEDNLKPLLEDSRNEKDRITPKSLENSPCQNLPRVCVSKDAKAEGQDVNPHNGSDEKSVDKDRQSNDNGEPKKTFLTPSYIANLGSNFVYRGAHPKAKKHAMRSAKDDPERHKRKIARARERRATIVLGIIMATFIGCWLPFFFIYPVSSLAKFEVPRTVFAIIFWLGYCNSALNPIIYTIFNQDFRRAFKKILFERRRGAF